jgi:hypothetical protein
MHSSKNSSLYSSSYTFSYLLYKPPHPNTLQSSNKQSNQKLFKTHFIFKKKMASMKVACVVLAMCMIFEPISEAALSCGTVTSNVAPCIGYVKGGPGPSQACCAGVKRLNAAAATTPDRQTACNCLKSAAGAISGLDNNIAAGLPSKCGVNIPYKISTSTNCKTYVFYLTFYILSILITHIKILKIISYFLFLDIVLL